MSERIGGNRIPFVFERLKVERLTGISCPFELTDFCPGMNVVTGPNGSGKSRTALALQRVVCREHSDKKTMVTVSAMGRVGDSRLRFQSAEGKTVADQDGVVVSPSWMLAKGEPTLDRYLLSLQELLAIEKKGHAEFAAKMRELSAGGFDIDRVADGLYLRTKTNATKVTGPVDDARKAYKQAQDAVAEIGRAALEIDGLVAQRDAAREAGRDLESILKVQRLRVAQSEHARLVAEQSLYPQAVAHLTGDERRRLDQHVVRIRELREKESQAVVLKQAATDRLAATGFVDGLPEDAATEGLQAAVDQLERDDHTVGQHMEGVKEATAQVDAALAGLTGPDVRRATGLGDAELQRIEESVVAAAGLAREADILGRIERIRQRVVPQPVADRAMVSDALDVLEEFLTVQTAGPARAMGIRLVLVAAAVLALFSVVMVATGAVWAVLGVAIAAGLLLATRMQMPAAAQRDWSSAYRATGMTEPEAWTASGVRARLEELLKLQAAVVLSAEADRALAQIQPERDDLLQRLADHDRQRAALVNEVGVSIELGAETVRVLFDRIRQAHGAKVVLESRLAGLEEAKQRRLAALADVNARLGLAGAEALKDAASARGEVNAFQTRIRVARQVVGDIATHADTIGRCSADAAEQQTLIDAVYASAEVKPDDVSSLDALLAQLPGFRASREECAKAEWAVQQASKGIADDSPLLDLADDDLAVRYHEAQAKATTFDGLAEEITRRQTRLDQASHGATVEAANLKWIAEKERMTSDMEAQERAHVGFWLASKVSAETRETSKSVVWAAQNLFGAFTKGRYRLDLDRTGTEFCAVDLQSDERLSLDQLSSATRLQLLLAVRIALVENLENGTMLPLLFDETLANSDDVRADAIIDATLEICRTGRQVIYFTAQEDEVGKWQARAADVGDVPLRVIDLAVARGLAV